MSEAASSSKPAAATAEVVAKLPLGDVTTSGAVGGAGAVSASPMTASKAKSSKPAGRAANGKKAAPIDPLEAARLAEEARIAAKQLEAKQAIEDIPHQQMIKARRIDVQSRNTLLASSVSSLKSDLDRSDADSADVLKYLENEVRRKDILTKKLGKEIKSLYDGQVCEKVDANARYAAEIAELEATFREKERELLELNRIRHQEYNDLLLFQRIRGELHAELASTKAVVLRNEKRHALQMADLEKKFMTARDRLLVESADRIAESRRNYKEEVGRELDLESKFISGENAKMTQELAFHQTLIERLQTTNAELATIVATLETSVGALARRDVAHASASLRNGKVLAELRVKHGILSSGLKEIADDEKTDAAAAAALMPGTSGDPHAPLRQEIAKLDQLASLRARENESLRAQLGLFTAQRNDVERLFLESLLTVKEEVAARRHAAYLREVEAHRSRLKQLGAEMYQPRGAKGTSSSSSSSVVVRVASDPRLPPPVRPVTDVRKIGLDDLTLADRERVLQLLFEKLNASAVSVGGTPDRARTRASSALSLTAGSSASSTSLVVSRPSSSVVRAAQRPISSSSSSSRPTSSTRPRGTLKPATSPSVPPVDIARADLRPADLARLGSHADKLDRSTPARRTTGGGARSRPRAIEEKDAALLPSFFPPRGDTPTELLSVVDPLVSETLAWAESQCTASPPRAESHASLVSSAVDVRGAGGVAALKAWVCQALGLPLPAPSALLLRPVAAALQHHTNDDDGLAVISVPRSFGLSTTTGARGDAVSYVLTPPTGVRGVTKVIKSRSTFRQEAAALTLIHSLLPAPRFAHYPLALAAAWAVIPTTIPTASGSSATSGFARPYSVSSLVTSSVGSSTSSSAGLNDPNACLGGLLLMECAAGVPVSECLKQVGRAAFGSGERVILFGDLTAALQHAARALAELHLASRVPSLPAAEAAPFIGETRRQMEEMLSKVSLEDYAATRAKWTILADIPRITTCMREMAQRATEAPGVCCLIHGDAHAGNMLWDTAQQRLTMIDLPTMLQATHVVAIERDETAADTAFPLPVGHFRLDHLREDEPKKSTRIDAPSTATAAGPHSVVARHTAVCAIPSESSQRRELLVLRGSALASRDVAHFERKLDSFGAQADLTSTELEQARDAFRHAYEEEVATTRTSQVADGGGLEEPPLLTPAATHFFALRSLLGEVTQLVRHDPGAIRERTMRQLEEMIAAQT